MTEHNPYLAPEAGLADGPAPVRPRFYVVSKAKFWALYLGTLGLYGIYWMYQHWANLKRARKSDEWPVMRGIFGIFFVHSLFAEFDQELARRGIRHEWSRVPIATATVILMLASNIMDRMAWRGVGSPYIDVLSLGVLPLIAFLAWQGQQAANEACEDPRGEGNRRFTAANIIWLVIGTLWWLLVLLSLFVIVFMPEVL
ncbi:hypothetical protein [Arenimonas sp.]|uniref:hypothetical protein n=1 Tax=Arenimonas sp. TaxID=1872635 RepID=UPI0039E543CB